VSHHLDLPDDSGNHPLREPTPGLAFIDLHCHTAVSFDSLADPLKVARAAAARGLTHLAITDHDRIEGALRARDAAPAGLTVIVGEEVKCAVGDLICVFLEEPIPPGLPPAETIARVRAQGGLVGIPHPFDKYRNSTGKAEAELEAIAGLVDWVEAFNARVVFREGNERAAAFAARVGLPGVAVSDAHSLLEVGVASTRLHGDPSTPEGLKAALSVAADLQPGRATYFARGFTPLAKLVNRVRGNGRVRPQAGDGRQ
jgi:predicted metal-dependent phosphoesterase TrpH